MQFNITVEYTFFIAGTMTDHTVDLPGDTTLRMLRDFMQVLLGGPTVHRMWLVAANNEAIHFGNLHTENDHMRIDQFAVDDTIMISVFRASTPIDSTPAMYSTMRIA